MSWQDDLSVRLEQGASAVVSDINAYIKMRVTDPVIKIGQPQMGNLTQQQIDQGQRGANQDASVGPEASSNGVDNTYMYIGVAVVLGVVAYYFMGKKRG